MIRNLIPRASIYTSLAFIFIALLTISNAQEHYWFLGKWTAYQGFDVYRLENLSDGTYTFMFNTDQYIERGTWQLSEGQLTQNWNDPNTGEATSATYDLEKLSDTAFNQSGGNLSEGFVFAYTKVTGEAGAENTEPVEVPFVEVVPGSYSCFIGSASPVDAYADETSLVLELRPDTTYAATSSSVSDEGALSAQPIGQEVFIRYLPLEFFPSASRLELTNSKGQAQAFIFAQDVKGNSYLFQGNEGSWLRCQIGGADVEDTLYSAYNVMNAVASKERAVANNRIPALTPLAEVVPGAYQCSYSYDDYNLDTGAHEPDPFEQSITLELFPGNVYLFCNVEDGCQDAERDNLFNLAEDGTVTWVGGNMSLSHGDKTSLYGQDAEGTPTLLMYEEDDDVFTGNWLYHVYQCPRVGDATSASPAEQATAEYQLLPPDNVAPAPPEGAGGLEGLYVYVDTSLEYKLDYGLGGMTTRLALDSPRFKYFMPDGYVYHGIYAWGYEDLDCTRMTKENELLCDTYVINGDRITYGDGDSNAFEKVGDDIKINNDIYVYRPPAPEGFTLEGDFYNTNANSADFVSSSYYTFIKDGRFTTDRESGFGGTLPGGDVSVSGYIENASKQGSYKIYGNTIELTYDDGWTEETSFSVSLDEAGQVSELWIGGMPLWKR